MTLLTIVNSSVISLTRTELQFNNDRINTDAITLLNLKSQISITKLKNFQNLAYVGTVSVGTPPFHQNFSVVFDTGSADFWIPSKDAFLSNSADSTFSTSNIQRFDPSASKNFKALNKTWSISYGTGNASGILGDDLVAIGTIEPFHQVFALANYVDYRVSSGIVYDGIVGLAFQEASESGAPSVVQTMKQQEKIGNAILTVDLGSSLIEIGSYNILENLTGANLSSSHFDSFDSLIGEVMRDPFLIASSENISRIKPENEGMWSVKIDVLVDDGLSGAISICDNQSDPCVGVMDTGTALFIMPYDRCLRFQSELQKVRPDCSIDYRSQWIITCGGEDYFDFATGIAAASSVLPVISIKIGGVLFNLTGDDYLLQSDSSSNGVQVLSIACDQEFSTFILGDIFLKKFIGVFDYDNEQVFVIQSLNRTRTDYDSPSYSLPWIALFLALTFSLICIIYIVRTTSSNNFPLRKRN
jgi:hypothetical protein